MFTALLLLNLLILRSPHNVKTLTSNSRCALKRVIAYFLLYLAVEPCKNMWIPVWCFFPRQMCSCVRLLSNLWTMPRVVSLCFLDMTEVYHCVVVQIPPIGCDISIFNKAPFYSLKQSFLNKGYVEAVCLCSSPVQALHWIPGRHRWPLTCLHAALQLTTSAHFTSNMEPRQEQRHPLTSAVTHWEMKPDCSSYRPEDVD